MRNQIWQTEVTVFGKLPQMLVKGYFIKPLLHYNAVLQIVPQKVGCYKKVHKVKSGAKEDDLSNINKRLPKWILDEAQAGIKIARRNINNLRYTDDITLMAESKEELKSLLMKVKEESEKVGLKFYIQKTKILASGPITSWQIDGKTMETVTDFIFGGLQNHCRWWLQPWN